VFDASRKLFKVAINWKQVALTIYGLFTPGHLIADSYLIYLNDSITLRLAND